MQYDFNPITNQLFEQFVFRVADQILNDFYRFEKQITKLQTLFSAFLTLFSLLVVFQIIAFLNNLFIFQLYLLNP